MPSEQKSLRVFASRGPFPLANARIIPSEFISVRNGKLRRGVFALLSLMGASEWIRERSAPGPRGRAEQRAWRGEMMRIYEELGVPPFLILPYRPATPVVTNVSGLLRSVSSCVH